METSPDAHRSLLRKEEDVQFPHSFTPECYGWRRLLRHTQSSTFTPTWKHALSFRPEAQPITEENREWTWSAENRDGDLRFSCQSEATSQWTWAPFLVHLPSVQFFGSSQKQRPLGQRWGVLPILPPRNVTYKETADNPSPVRVCHGPPGLLCVAAISLSVWICSVFVFVSLTRPAGSRIQDLHPPPLTVQVNQLPSVSLLSCCCLKDYSFVISSVQQPWCCFPAERERERQLWISAGRSVSRLRDDLKPSPQWHLLDNLAITIGVNGALALSEYLVTWGLGFSSPFKRLKRSSVMWKPGFQHPVTPVYLLYLFDRLTL